MLPLRLSVFLLVSVSFSAPCVIELVLFSHSEASLYLSLSLFLCVSCSFHLLECLSSSQPLHSFLSGPLWGLSLLVPPQAPCAFSTLFFGVTPHPPTAASSSSLSALNMSLQSAAKSYKQALNYNKTMGALLSNGSVLAVTVRLCI